MPTTPRQRTEPNNHGKVPIVSIERKDADKDSILDYSTDWSEWLAEGEQIVTSEWLVTEGNPEDVELLQSGVIDKEDALGNVLSVQSVAYSFIGFTDTALDGNDYVITNRITTTNSPPRQEDKSVRLVLIEK